MQPVEFFNKLNEEGGIIKSRLNSLKTTSACSEGVLRLWEEGKLLCPDWERDRLWLNVIGHMVTVAFLAERLALLLLTKNIPINVIEVVQAGLVHDWEKRRRQMPEMKPRRVALTWLRLLSVSRELGTR